MIPHGRYSKYSNDGCRCDACTKAWADYYRHRRFMRKHHGEALGFSPEHGKASTYTNWGCRCDLCREAIRLRPPRVSLAGPV